MPAKLLPPILVVAIELIEKRDGLLQTLTSKLQFPAGEIAAFLSKINALAQGVGTEDLLKEEGITHLDSPSTQGRSRKNQRVWARNGRTLNKTMPAFWSTLSIILWMAKAAFVTGEMLLVN